MVWLNKEQHRTDNCTVWTAVWTCVWFSLFVSHTVRILKNYGLNKNILLLSSFCGVDVIFRLSFRRRYAPNAWHQKSFSYKTFWRWSNVSTAAKNNDLTPTLAIPKHFLIAYHLWVSYCQHVPPCFRRSQCAKHNSIKSLKNQNWHKCNTKKMAVRNYNDHF